MDRHSLTVYAKGDSLKVLCACGEIIKGQRDDDKPDQMTVVDLVGLIRLHTNEINRP